jgi:hypothetical protein
MTIRYRGTLEGVSDTADNLTDPLRLIPDPDGNSGKALKAGDDLLQWTVMMKGGTATKTFMFLNSAPQHWSLSSIIPDRLLSIKGGSKYTTGGAVKGDSYLPTHTHGLDEHRHIWGHVSGPSGTWLYMYNSDGGMRNVGKDTYYVDSGNYTMQVPTKIPGYTYLYTTYGGPTSTDPSSAATWRPTGAVGILVYPNP